MRSARGTCAARVGDGRQPLQGCQRSPRRPRPSRPPARAGAGCRRRTVRRERLPSRCLPTARTRSGWRRSIRGCSTAGCRRHIRRLRRPAGRSMTCWRARGQELSPCSSWLATTRNARACAPASASSRLAPCARRCGASRRLRAWWRRPFLVGDGMEVPPGIGVSSVAIAIARGRQPGSSPATMSPGEHERGTEDLSHPR